MSKKKTLLTATEKKFSNGGVLHIVDIKKINQDLEELIDNNLSKIHNKSKHDLRRTKILIKDFFENKKTIEGLSDNAIGSIAEFFVHLYLSEKGYSQECLYQNLEEDKSIKKGFDGYYSTENGDEWVMETKSSRKKSNINHKNNIQVAYNDLKDKFSGKKPNPWENAWNHAKVADSSKKILDSIKKLSNDFIDGKRHNVSEFNIIPSSTVFLNDVWERIDQENIYNEINTYVQKKEYKKINVVCITQQTANLFLDYLNK